MMKTKITLSLLLFLFLFVSFAWAQEFEKPKPTADMSGNIGPVRPMIPNPGVDAQWDLVFWFDAQTPVNDAYLLGCEYAGGHFYITAGSSYGGIAPNNRVFVYDATGAIVDTFNQWSTVGGWGWRDIAYDGTYLYASDDNTVDAFDLNGNPVPASNITVTPPAGGAFPRALAYDPATDHFWCGNFGSYLYEFTRAGAIVWSGAPSPLLAVYGMAWDDAGPGGPWLWIHDQSPEAAGPNGSTIYQFNPTTHVFTGVSYNVPYIGGATSQLAGGLAFTDEHIPGFYTLLGITQGTPTDNLFELEMYPSAHPDAPAAPTSFTVNHNGAVLTASLQWTNPTLTVSGNPLTSIDSVVVERNGTMVRSWTVVTPGQVMTYSNIVPSAGMYTYTVYAVNDSGNGISASESKWIGLDAPGAVTSLTGAGVGELLQAQLNWVNPTVGAHGGYYPAGNIVGYTVNRYGVSTASFNVIGLQTGYLDNTILAAGEYWYGVIPYNNSGNGPETFTSQFLVGPTMHGSYDIGGGLMHYPDLVSAAAALVSLGMSAPVTFNIYTGTYNGQVELPAIAGNNATNTITFQPATGQLPVITNNLGTGTTGGNGFRLVGADYVTIQGLEITDCQYTAIYNYYSPDTSIYNRFIGNYIHNVGTGGSYYAMYLYRGRGLEVIGNEIEGDYYGIYNYYGVDNLFANNMLYGATYNAIRDYYSAYCRFLYNSVYTIGTYTVYHYNSTSYPPASEYYNNIFFNYGTGYAFYNGSSTLPPSASDYNDLYAPTGNVGYSGGALNTLAAWQTATGLDANSISVDPNFVSYTDIPDLHIETAFPSPVDNVGTPIAAVTTDFDGDTRSLTTPDIGADEFALIPMDYCVILTPETSEAGEEPNNSVDHMLFVDNCGTQNDAYNLSVSVTGETWTHTIKDHTGTTTIDSIVVNAGQIDSFLVRVSIPSGALLGDISTGQVVVNSRHGSDNILTDTSTTTTTAIIVLTGEYDIGGGANDFTDLISAANAMQTYGLAGPVIFNVYNGTYDGQVELPAIVNNDATNTITFRAATGQSPVITNTIGTSTTTGAIFRITGADYVTIQGLEMTNCYYAGIYNYYSPDSSNHNSFIGNYIHNVGTGGSYYSIYIYRGIDCRVIGNEIEGDYYGIYNYYGEGNFIANNMIYGVGYYGMYTYYGNNNLYYHNSLYVSCTYAIYHYTSTAYVASTFLNNIFYQYGTGYSLYCGAGTIPLPVASDYNDLYAPSGNVGYWGVALNTLAAWQTATGLDANSISVDPNFVSYTDTPDLHIVTAVPSSVDNVGTPIAAVTTDFDGDPRDPVHPDIGADEFDLASLQYCVFLTPETSEGGSAPNTAYDHMFVVNNCGAQNDAYDITVSVTGQPWTHTAMDYSGSTAIDSIVVNAGQVDSFLVRIAIPSGAVPGTNSTGEVVVHSRHGFDNILADTSTTITSAAAPLTGTYDIGGGANHFPDLITPAAAMQAYGIAGPVVFNIYNGTYDGQVELPAIVGNNETNTIKFQPAAGQSPVITNTIGTATTTGAIFRITGADYLTIRGLEMTNCYYAGIYNYYSPDSSNHNRFIGNYIHNVGTGGSYYAIYIYRGIDCQVIGNEIDGDYYGIYNYYGEGNFIANNMIYGVGYYGMYAYYGNNNLYYYNSLYVSCTYGVYHYSSTSYTPSTFINNIFYQAGTGYCIYNGGTTVPLPLASDYNDLYAPGGNVGYWGSAQNTLSAWQTATGLDANSISADPLFVSNTDTPDLHIITFLPSPVNRTATPLAAVTDDFDGDIRDLTNPDIGADEFTFVPLDYCVTLNPNATTSGAMPGRTVDHLFDIFNCGAQNDTYDLSVTVSGEAWTHEIRDYTGASIISSIAVDADSTKSFMVRVLIDPAAAFGSTSQGQLVALSQHAPARNIYSDTSYATTMALPYEQIPLNWVEIAGTAGGPGTNANIVGDDVNGGPFPIGFEFPYYNCVFFNAIRLCSNGWASFTSTVTAYSNVAIPTAAEPNNLLAPYWDDFTTSSTGTIWYYYDAANGRFIAEWYQVPHLSTGGVYTFEIILYQNGTIEYMYNEITHGTPISCTVGIENDSGTVGIQCTYNGSGPLEPVTGMGIHFTPPCPYCPPVEDLVITLTSPLDVSHVVLSWSDVGADEYNIYKSDQPGSGYTLLGTTANTQYTDPNAVVGTTKAFYYVTAVIGALDRGVAVTFPPDNLRYLFQPTHVEMGTRK